jgi:hypothetical protein
VRLDVGSPQIDSKVRNLLRPAEYTRLDALVDLVFSAAKDVEQSAPPPPLEISSEALIAEKAGPSTFEFTPSADLQAKRASIVKQFEESRRAEMQKKSRAIFSSADGQVRAVISLSKRYDKPVGRPYWYAYHPDWDDFLGNAPTGEFVLGMMDREQAYALPTGVIRPLAGQVEYDYTPKR